MRRRPLLAALGALSASLGTAGCIADAPTTGDRNGRDEWRDPDEYERCPRLVVDVDWLPEPARIEVETALEDGRYETDDPLYLPRVLDPAYSYLEGDDGYYRASVHDDGTWSRLELEETIPSHGTANLDVRNEGDVPVTVEIEVERLRDGETLVDEPFTVDAGARVTVVDGMDRVFGRYRATIATEGFTEVISWQERELAEPLSTIVVEDGEAYPEPRIVQDPMSCQAVWGTN